ncbi:MAG: response regulator [Oligoflexia bacterium]|nr:response regulator [Oligoflexia bacterium]
MAQAVKVPLDTIFLHLEDMPTMRDLLRSDLKKIGFTRAPIEAENVQQALNFVYNNANTIEKIQFIISDWNLPDDTGLTFLKKVREIEEFNTVPFIMATNENEITHMLDAINAGCTNYIIKPWEAKDLKEKIESSWGTVFSPPGSLKQKKLVVSVSLPTTKADATVTKTVPITNTKTTIAHKDKTGSTTEMATSVGTGVATSVGTNVGTKIGGIPRRASGPRAVAAAAAAAATNKNVTSVTTGAGAGVGKRRGPLANQLPNQEKRGANATPTPTPTPQKSLLAKILGLFKK